MNPDRLLRTFLELVQLDSPSGGERNVADYVIAAMRSIGAEVNEDEAASQTGGNAGNVIARLSGKGASLFLAAHMDTAPHSVPIRPIIADGIVRSSGDTILGADDKSAVAVIIELARRLKELGARHRPLELIFTVCEETELLGAKALDFSRLAAREGYALDGANPALVVRGAPGKIAFDVNVIGRSGHGTRPEETINPIVVAAEAIRRLPTGRIDDETTGNVGVINAGAAVNVVPENARLLLEVRSHNAEKLTRRVEEIENAFVSACAEAVARDENGKTVSARAEIKRNVCYQAFSFEENAPLVQNAFAAIARAGLVPKSKLGAGGLDANVFNARGLRCVGLGAGAYSAHAVREYLVIEEMTKAVDVAFHIAIT